MRPTRGLQDMTSWRMLSGSIPFEKRFDPEGPYEQAFEAGGWNTYVSQLKDEEKKKREQRAAYPQFMHDVMRNLPAYNRYAEKNGPFSVTARPWS